MTSRLLSLPAELRNRIYEYAIIEPYKLEIGYPGVEQPALTRTCTQIRQESLPIFYSGNKFALYQCNDYSRLELYSQVVTMLRWLDGIGIANRKALRRMLMCHTESVLGCAPIDETVQNVKAWMAEDGDGVRIGFRWGGPVVDEEDSCFGKTHRQCHHEMYVDA